MKTVSLADVPEEGVSHDPQIKKQVLFRNGELPHLTNFARSRLRPGQSTRPHAHRDMFEVFFVESGSGVMRVGGAERQLEAGVCVAVEPGEEHEVINTGAGELILNYFGLEG